MSQTITFGELEFHFSTSTPLVGGLTENRPYDFNHDVKYEHIKPHANILKTSEPSRTARPIKGAVLEGVPIQVVAQSEAATLHAIKKRCDHRPQEDVSSSFVDGHNMLMDIVHERDEIRLDREAIEAYLSEMAGEKRERLSALLDSQDFTLPGYTDKVVFAKSEVLLKSDGAQPRVVYQGGDMYNLVMGSVVYYLSRRIAEELNRSNPRNKGNQVLYCVGMSADEIADLVHHTKGEAYENDFKNNDGTQPAGVRKWESMFYYKLGAPKWFVREFAGNTSVRIFTRYGVRGKVSGQRWSGEVTTTTGNGYVNACISLAALKRANITESTTFVYGDDNMTYTVQDRRPVRDAFSTVSQEQGMTSEFKIVDKREQATFLRKRFVPTSSHTYPVPSFGRVLAKLPVRSNFNKAVRDEDYMAGKLLSAAYEHRHIASLRALLLETADQMSSQPYMDMRNQAAAYKYTATELKDLTVNAKVIDSDYMGSFLTSVYGVSLQELEECYASVCDGILGFRRINSAGASRRINDPTTLAPRLPRALWNTAFESLVNIDVV